MRNKGKFNEKSPKISTRNEVVGFVALGLHFTYFAM